MLADNTKSRYVLLLLWLAVFGTAAIAQSNPIRISGMVLDPSGIPVTGAVGIRMVSWVGGSISWRFGSSR